MTVELAGPPASPGEMLSGVGARLLVVLLLVLLNAFFVAAEFALVSVRRSRIDQMAADGDRAAHHV
ncbi:MAG: CNNM domain-containing protein, partial [Gemmatimonadaceae bacterium]